MAPLPAPAAAGTAVAQMTGMQSLHPPQDTPGLEGPDYVALVIEWDEEVPTVVRATKLTQAPTPRHQLITVLSAVAALVLTTWGIRRFRLAR